MSDMTKTNSADAGKSVQAPLKERDMLEVVLGIHALLEVLNKTLLELPAKLAEAVQGNQDSCQKDAVGQAMRELRDITWNKRLEEWLDTPDAERELKSLGGRFTVERLMEAAMVPANQRSSGMHRRLSQIMRSKGYEIIRIGTKDNGDTYYTTVERARSTGGQP